MKHIHSSCAPAHRQVNSHQHRAPWEAKKKHRKSKQEETRNGPEALPFDTDSLQKTILAPPTLLMIFILLMSWTALYPAVSGYHRTTRQEKKALILMDFLFFSLLVLFLLNHPGLHPISDWRARVMGRPMNSAPLTLCPNLPDSTRCPQCHARWLSLFFLHSSA